MRKMALKTFFAVMLLIVVFFISGCGSSTDGNVKNAAYEIIDDQGAIIQLEHKPERILTLAMGTDISVYRQCHIVPAHISAALTVRTVVELDVEQEDVKAEFKHGILKLFVPKKEAKKAVEENKYIAIEG